MTIAKLVNQLCDQTSYDVFRTLVRDARANQPQLLLEIERLARPAHLLVAAQDAARTSLGVKTSSAEHFRHLCRKSVHAAARISNLRTPVRNGHDVPLEPDISRQWGQLFISGLPAVQSLIIARIRSIQSRLALASPALAFLPNDEILAAYAIVRKKYAHTVANHEAHASLKIAVELYLHQRSKDDDNKRVSLESLILSDFGHVSSVVADLWKHLKAGLP